MEANHQATANRTGSGTGLAYTRKIVNLHKDTVAVQSETVMGGGFTETLPLIETPVNEKAESKQNHIANGLLHSKTPMLHESACNTMSSRKNGAKTILLIEDHAKLRDFLHEHLSENYRKIEAENGEEEPYLTQKENPALIISDILLPGMDGYELSSKLKTNERTRHIPIILLTAKGTGKQWLEDLSKGPDDYLIKPFSPDILLARVDNLLKSRKKLANRAIKDIDVRITKDSPTSEKQFIQRAKAIVMANIYDAKFNTEDLAKKMGMSRTMLFNKFKSLTGESGGSFILTIRMKLSAEYLVKSSFNISEICYHVGFSDPRYFRKVFKKHYGISPSEYGAKLGKADKD